MTTSRSALVVVSGLPGTGKSTLARAYVRASGASYLRIDTIEQTLVSRTPLEQPLGPIGYELGYALAAEQLRAGTRIVVAECVNPLGITRDAWSAAGSAANAAVIDVEVVCSDPIEHRRRVETRHADIPGLRLPTWADVQRREYEAWDRERLVVDTSTLAPEQGAELIAEQVGHSEEAI